MPTAAFLVLMGIVRTGFGQAPAIQANGVNINAVPGRGGEFQVAGAAIAVASDLTDLDTRVTAAVEAVRSGLTDRIDALELAAAANATDTAAAFVNSNTAVAAVQSALDTFIEEQAETLAGLEAGISGAVGWMGGYNASAACTTEQCAIIVYGRGFVALPRTPSDGPVIYAVTVAIDETGSSTTMPCEIDTVQPTYIQCTVADFQGPPSRSFWLSASVTENGQPFPYAGANPNQPVRVAQMQALGPTVSFDGTEFLSYSSQNGAVMTHTEEINIADPDHPNSALTVTFTSSNAAVLPTGGMSYSASTGLVTFTFQSVGSANIQITVTDVHNFSASVTIAATLVENSFECSDPALFSPGGESCSQNPVDQAWGRNNPDCAALLDGSLSWHPNTARHLDMPDGEILLEFNAMTVYNVNVIQKAQHRHGYFELHAKDLNSNSATYGQFVRFFQSGFTESNGFTSPVGPDSDDGSRSTTTAPVPASLRRTDSIKFVSVVPDSVDISFTFVMVYRILEMQLVGCA